MADIIKKKDNDKKFVFECPICGTIFTERERNIEKYGNLDTMAESVSMFRYVVRCPNCEIRSEYSEPEEYDKNKDY